MDRILNPIKERLSFVQKFVLFIRTQGVIGLAVAFVIGGAVQKVVSALVTDIVNPLIGLALGRAANLKEMSTTIGSSVFLWGDFLSTLLDFLIIAFAIYILINFLRVDMLDKKKE
jgi:large conductance mechanosensitive channel